MTTKHISRRSRRALAVSCGAVLATAGLSPSVVQAAEPVLENSHFNFGYEHIEQEIGECLDVPFLLHHDGHTNATIQLRTRGTDGPEYFSLRYNTDDVYSNLETGESFTARSAVREADTRITENADGTVTISFSATETTTVHTPSGALYGVDSLRVTTTVHLDLGDPENPDDDVVISEEQSAPTGVSGLGGFDLCSVAESLLG